MLTLFIIIPLGCAFLIPLLAKITKGDGRFLAGFCGLSLLMLSLSSLFWIKPLVYSVGGWKPPFGICLVLDDLSVLMLLVVNLIGCLAILYSFDYIKIFTVPYLYYTLFCLLLAGLNGVIITGDLFNLFVFLEISAIASYALVAFGTEAEELEASFKYIVLGSVASVMILLSIGLIYGKFSTLNMADIAISLRNAKDANNVILFCFALFIMGFGLKTALVPFHAWLPDAHPSAPAPISAMLSGVVIKTIGAYALVRVVFNMMGANPVVLNIFIWLGILSMVIGVLLAIGQWDFKRLLAYHSISQIGYVIFGIGLGSKLGIIGGLFHLFNHSLFKSLLFLNAGAVDYRCKSRDLHKLGGLARKMPVTGVTSLIASFSIAGIPPFCGFFSKLLIIIAAFQAGNVIGGFTCIVVGVITLASFLKVQKYVFLRDTEEHCVDVKEVPVFMLITMVVLALLCLAAGLLYFPLTQKVFSPAAAVLLEGIHYAYKVLGG
ncbi:MAG: complex I subunit 5 family protein [Candidatus Omnitrophota bacterium]